MRNYFELNDDELKRADKLYEESLVIDFLTFVGGELKNEEEYFKMVKNAGVSAVHVTVNQQPNGFRQAIQGLDEWGRKIEKSDIAVLATTVDDILEAKKNDKIAFIAGWQNAKPFEDNIKNVRVFKKLGLRVVLLAYHYQNFVASGGGERHDGGLSRFGINLVRELNQQGILIDLSHCGPQSVLDAIKYSQAPVAITHANPAAFGDHPRNKSDEALKACAEKGGMIGLSAWSEHLETKLGRRPTIHDFIEMIDYVVNLIGVDHVGFGLDLTPLLEQDGPRGYKYLGGIYPEAFNSKYEERNFEGLSDYDCVINITRGLVARGYSDEDIKKINGENWIKFLKKVWGNPPKIDNVEIEGHIVGGA